MGKIVNQTAIAKQLGVSQRAVSFALNGKPGVASETRKRVLEAADRLGYRINGAARATRTRRFGQVAMLESVDRTYSFRPAPLLHGVHDRLAEHDLNTVYVKLPDAKLVSQGFVPRILRELMVDGLLVNYRYNTPPKMIEMVEQNRLPAVWLGWSREHDCVHPDERDAGRRMTEHLLALGHRRIALMDFGNGIDITPSARPSQVDRRRGYLDAMANAGLDPLLLCKAASEDERVPFVTEHMSGPDRPTAVVLVALLHAEWVLPALEQKLGLSVPGDVSVVSFSHASPRVGLKNVTTMFTPHAECGKAAVDMLLSKIKTPDQLFDPVCPKGNLRDGETVGPPAMRNCQGKS